MTRAISTGVLTNSVVGSFLVCLYKSLFLAENTIKLVASAKTPKNANKVVLKTGPRLCLKTGPSMLRNIIGPIANTTFIFVYPRLSAGRKRFSTKNKIDQFLAQKGQ